MSSLTIRNPVIPGFNPDPSFVRVGEDYYIATSTFEWWPGVQLHLSRDLVHWRLIGHALTRPNQLNLQGVVDSAGVWAPSLSYADGQFWLIYTNVRQRLTNYKDVQIFLATAPDILGPWSDPVRLDGIGFDPSLFHDDDGRKWLLNMMWDFRKGHARFAGIVVQEYDHGLRRLIGPRSHILQKPVLTEGPNLYKHDGWYYLMLAEGGTGWNHGISMARSRAITGPYELDPQHSLITTRDVEGKWPLQKAGHGELAQTSAGEWYLAHLASRPLPGQRCMLGREVCLQRVEWREGWLRLAQGGHHPAVEVPGPRDTQPAPFPPLPARDDFDSPTLDVNFATLRGGPTEDWLTLTERPGWLRLRGRESQHSLFAQSLVARRLQSFTCTVETCLEFAPTHFTQMAGLLAYYDTRTHYYLRVTHHEERGVILGVVLTDDGAYDELGDDLAVGDWPRFYLRAEIYHACLRFSASPDGTDWRAIGPELDASKLSDDYGQGLHFTGAMVGIAVHDVGGTNALADFDYFEMRQATSNDPAGT